MVDMIEFIKDRQERFNKAYGEPKTGREVSQRYLDLGRQTGKTTMMIKAFPNDTNFVVFIANYNYRQYIIDRIRDLRPDIDINNIIFMVLKNVKEIPDKLRGIRAPIFIDDTVWYEFQRELIYEVHDFLRIFER